MSPWYASVMRPIAAADDSTVSTQGANKSADIPGEGGGENIGVEEGESDRAIWLPGE